MADEYPDLGKALQTYLKESTVLADSEHLGSSSLIYKGLPTDKLGNLNAVPFSNMLVILVGRGGEGDIGLALRRVRVDFQCYGTDEGRCKRIAAALGWYFNPLDAHRKTSFTRNGCRVLTIIEEGSPLSLVDANASNWPYTSSTWIVTYSGVPAS